MTIHSLRPLGPTALLRATAPRLAAMQVQAASVFAANLHNHTADLALPAALSDAVFDALASSGPRIDQPEFCRDTLGALALRLRQAGLSLRDYIAVQSAFLDTITQCLGDDPALLAAWRRALATLLAAMMSAAHGPRRAAGPLAA